MSTDASKTWRDCDARSVLTAARVAGTLYPGVVSFEGVSPPDDSGVSVTNKVPVSVGPEPNVAAQFPLAPTLDRTVEPWVGDFPGLGRVRVAADGEVTIEVADADVDDDVPADPNAASNRRLREEALYHGWGEPLSWVRRGFHLVGGAAVGPADSDACALILGDPHDVAIVVLELASYGWQLLSDRPAPVTWDDDRIMAQARQTPLVVAKRRAQKAGVEGEPVRADTDAVAVAVARAQQPRKVAAAVQVRVRRPDNEVLDVLTGHERFEAATALYIGGVLEPTVGDLDEVPDTELEAATPTLLAEHLRIAQLPWARLHLSSKTATEDTAELVNWWDGVHYSQNAAT